jgi:hypothetical protein
MVIPAMQSNIFPPTHPPTNKHQSSRGQKNPPHHATPRYSIHYKLKKNHKEKPRTIRNILFITSKTIDPRTNVPHHDVSYVNEEVIPSYE